MFAVTGATVGAGHPSAAKRSQVEVGVGRRERAQTLRIRTDALRNDDGRHPIEALQVAPGDGRRNDSASRQERRACRHSGIHPISPASSQGEPLIPIDYLLCFFFFKFKTKSSNWSRRLRGNCGR